ncbi:hypothetical protein NIM87_15840 [Devosia sp. XJ19-1]|uniref:Uncharacterized protein n=1 Tax=Devosia ureilytica TaxID=2952754 RepID=A0A9Q4AQX2_9HYPH|nr:hypothetical protein [Devosia ureilytica]MCP8884982.1 hypothetical protein [Devosia ureilytica]MCP8888507.1 hypothetical protein [Devosia ureilytica]
MRKATSLVAFLLLSGPAMAEPFHHPFGEWREYNRDWLAACPDAIVEGSGDFYGYSCFASTGSQELNGANLPAYKLTLIRNRLDGTLDLAITVSPETGEYDPARPITLSFGGEPPVNLAMGTDIETRHNTINQFFIADAEQLAAIIDTMKDRNAVTLSVPLVGQDEPVETWLSLRGVLASLDFMETYARKVAQY